VAICGRDGPHGVLDGPAVGPGILPCEEALIAGLLRHVEHTLCLKVFRRSGGTAELGGKPALDLGETVVGVFEEINARTVVQ
jgi:hypothetical protein